LVSLKLGLKHIIPAVFGELTVAAVIAEVAIFAIVALK